MREILRVHNQWRAKIANGLVTRGRPGPQPPAADMEQMVILFLIQYTTTQLKIMLHHFSDVVLSFISFHHCHVSFWIATKYHSLYFSQLLIKCNALYLLFFHFLFYVLSN